MCPRLHSGAAREFYDRTEVALRAGFITGLPRFAHDDGDAGLVLEGGSRILDGVSGAAPFVVSLVEG